MAINAVAGHPDYGNSSTGSQHIPEIFSMNTLVKFYTKTVFAAISNTEYEGEIKKFGDKVIVRTVPDITISDYTKGMEITYEAPNSEEVQLDIDKAKYWAIRIDDVDTLQADLSWMPKYAEDASSQMQITIDADVLANFYADAHASNAGATAGYKTSAFNLGATGAAITITKANVLEYIIDCGTVLDEIDCPEEDRNMVIPAWMAGLIKKSDLKDASLSGDGTSILRNGRLGMIDRFTLYRSNQVDSEAGSGADAGVTCYQIPFCQKRGLTFASQMTDTAGPFPLEKTIGHGMRGLNVYGYKTMKPEAVGYMYAKKG